MSWRSSKKSSRKNQMSWKTTQMMSSSSRTSQRSSNWMKIQRSSNWMKIQRSSSWKTSRKTIQMNWMKNWTSQMKN